MGKAWYGNLCEGEMIFIPAGILYLGRRKSIKIRGEKSRLAIFIFEFLRFVGIGSFFSPGEGGKGEFKGTTPWFSILVWCSLLLLSDLEKAEACSEECGSRS